MRCWLSGKTTSRSGGIYEAVIILKSTVSYIKIHNRMRKFVGYLILISGITHVSQYWVYAPEQGALAATAAVSGFILLILGPSLLLRQSRSLLWIAMILHAVVAPPHIYHLFFMANTPITIFHFVVVTMKETCAGASAAPVKSSGATGMQMWHLRGKLTENDSVSDHSLAYPSSSIARRRM